MGPNDSAGTNLPVEIKSPLHLEQVQSFVPRIAVAQLASHHALSLHNNATSSSGPASLQRSNAFRVAASRLPPERSLHGCVVVVDISGFTRAEDRLNTLGRAGVDAFASLLDATLGERPAQTSARDDVVSCLVPGALTKVGLEAGGDVLEFAGDALIVLFEALEDVEDDADGLLSDPRAVEEECVGRGESCAYRMLQALQHSYNDSPVLQGKEGKMVRDLMGGKPFALHGGCAYGVVHVAHLTSHLGTTASRHCTGHAMTIRSGDL
eukprot:scaffold1440_cov377-Prasinococcus_capsulatus_cf.AAC.4